jgi:hypothetical protein
VEVRVLCAALLPLSLSGDRRLLRAMPCRAHGGSLAARSIATRRPLGGHRRKIPPPAARFVAASHAGSAVNGSSNDDGFRCETHIRQRSAATLLQRLRRDGTGSSSRRPPGAVLESAPTIPPSRYVVNYTMHFRWDNRTSRATHWCYWECRCMKFERSAAESCFSPPLQEKISRI